MDWNVFIFIIYTYMTGIIDPSLLINLQTAKTNYNNIMQQAIPTLNTSVGDSCDDYLNAVLNFAQSAVSLNQQRQTAYQNLTKAISDATLQVNQLATTKVATGPQYMNTSASDACLVANGNFTPILNTSNNPINWPDNCLGYSVCSPGSVFPSVGCQCGPGILATSQSFLCGYNPTSIQNALNIINSFSASPPTDIMWPVEINLACANCDTTINAGGNISGNISVIQNCKSQFDNNPPPPSPPPPSITIWEKIKNYYIDPKTQKLAIGGTVVGGLLFILTISLIIKLIKKN